MAARSEWISNLRAGFAAMQKTSPAKYR